MLRVGDSQDAIGHLRTSDRSHSEKRGIFAFDEARDTAAFTYPSMWSADATKQRHLEVKPTHDGTPESQDSTRIGRILDAKSNLVIATNYRQTSQALAAAWVTPNALGGRQWTTLMHEDEAVKKSMVIWLNSTMGLMSRVGYAQTTQRGRSAMQQGAIRDFPVPDFSANGDARTHARATAGLEFARLSKLQLMPGSLAWKDPARHEIDNAMLTMLGIADESTAQAMERIRQLWCREPSVHGGNRKILKALQLAQ